ncbi:hypothetical protein J6590_030210 [Homalodisca vitripennis]|nr:hypothetical protein J6590_030210 [Homalodisca vitripennis]
MRNCEFDKGTTNRQAKPMQDINIHCESYFCAISLLFRATPGFVDEKSHQKLKTIHLQPVGHRIRYTSTPVYVQVAQHCRYIPGARATPDRYRYRRDRLSSDCDSMTDMNGDVRMALNPPSPSTWRSARE